MAEKKPTFYMMVGVPCSGKTTYARQIPNATVLSSDDIRAEIGVDGGDKKMHKQVFDILHDRTKEALSAGIDVVYDATNLRHTRWMRLRDWPAARFAFILQSHWNRRCPRIPTAVHRFRKKSSSA